MTNLLARILLAVMLLPLAAVVYMVVLFPLMGRHRGRGAEEVAFLMASIVTATFVAYYWIWLWRDSVNWTKPRTAKTLLSGLGCIAAGIIVALILNAISGIHDPSFCFFIGGVIAIISWLPITVIIWKETPLERAERMRVADKDALFCPRCGYNMTGLNQARCPECGAQYTINQLFSAQHRPEIADAATPWEEKTPG
jgi:hypothetical protein